MIRVSPLESLGHADHGWLDAHHHFSFANYYNPERMGFGALRVWNDDLIRARKGFPMHPHEDMEIITYVRTGAVSHEDSLGNRGKTCAGQVQVMSAGTGIIHSEYNLEDRDLTLFQIWILPQEKGLSPRWDLQTFAPSKRDGRFQLMVSGRKAHLDLPEPPLFIHQDAALSCANLRPGGSVRYAIDDGRRVYLVPSDGEVDVNGHLVPSRAGVEIWNEKEVIISMKEDAVGQAEIVLLDLP